MDNNFKIISRGKHLFAVLLVTLFASLTPGQQSLPTDPTPSLNYGFVSPNTKENLRLDDAIRKMKSPEEAKLLTRIGTFSCVVQQKIRAFRSLGSWSDGAEYSVLLRVKSDEATVRYLLSRVGKEARQKSVLYFHPVASGSSRIYAVRTGKRTGGLTRIGAVLESAGLTFRTLVPTTRTTLVFIVDLNSELQDKVVKAAKRLKAKWSSEVGRAEFVGDATSAEKAQTVFNQEISKYEKEHPRLPSPCNAEIKGVAQR